MYADFIAGWLAGGAGLLVGHPLDTVKTRLQTMNVYSGFKDCLAKTVRNESMFGLYRGMLLPFVSAGALHSLLFASYATTLRILLPRRCPESEKDNLPFKEIVIATLCSAVVQLVPGIPIELIKTKLQVQRERRVFRLSRSAFQKQGQLSEKPFGVVISTYNKHGLCGFYKGGLAMFFRDVIGIGLYLPIYETAKYCLKRQGFQETLSEVLAGGTAGSLSWISVCPFEVVKNVAQTQSEPAKRQLLLAAKQIYETRGIAGFYKGGITLLTRGFVVNAVLFVVYEKSLRFFNS